MATASTTPDSRHLTFSDGSSDKFWKIVLEGSSHTVTFGRIGTSGQTQTKDFESAADARKSYDKLVAEKTKKGYADAAGGTTTPAAKASASTAAAKPAKAKPASKATKGAVTEPAESEPASDGNAAESPAAASTDVDLSVERSIDLDPVDWYWAAFRSLPQLKLESLRPFDRDESLSRIAKLKTTNYGNDTRWCDLNLPPRLSREEASFWFTAMTTGRPRDMKMKEFAEKVSKKKIASQFSLKTVRECMEPWQHGVEREVPLVLASLISVDDYVELMLGLSDLRSHNIGAMSLEMMSFVEAFHRVVVPYLSEAERESIRRRVRKSWDPQPKVDPDYGNYPGEFYLAAALGMHKEVAQAVGHWSDALFAQNIAWNDRFRRPMRILFGLDSPARILPELQRLKIRAYAAEDVRGLIACTEYAGLESIATDIISDTDRENCDSLLKVLALVRAPEAAVPLLQCKLSAKSPLAAREWLDHNVGRAVYGLIDTAGGRGKLAEAAMEYLRGVKLKGHAAVIAAAVQQAGKSEAAARVQAEILDQETKVYAPLDAKSTPSWLQKELDAVGSLKRKPLPAWAAPALLPPLIVKDRRLNDDQIGVVLQLLAATPATEKHPLLVALRQQVAKSVRDEFAWKLFQFWQEDGCPTKEKWAMGAIAQLGEDACILKLTPLIRNWPGESQHARAVFGLEIFRAIGSSIALMQLAGIAQKLKFKGLKAKAEQFVNEIAQERGLTRDELEDRVVPDCGLDESGRREFSFGSRKFSFVLPGDLKAMVRDEVGKLRPNLPDPGAKDDQTLAAESVTEWKLLKKQIKDVATIQAGRLEQAMVTGRRWNAEDYEALLVRHPLMTHLAQKLIWTGFDAKGKRLVTFRVTEERDFANPDDDAVKLTGVTSVGVVHPLELTDAERARWGEVLGDYEIVAPFAQLGRAVYALEAGEDKLDDLTRFHDMQLVAPTLVFTLEKLNWLRGVAMDAGCFDEHSKQFPAADVTAVIRYEGTVGMGYIDPNEMLTVESVHFCPGMRPRSGYGWDSKKKLALGKVPAIVISEVLADLQVLKSKEK